MTTPNSWSVEEVQNWLAQINFADIKSKFHENNVDGSKLLALTRKDMAVLGVSPTKERALEYQIHCLKEASKVVSRGRGVAFNITGFGPFCGVTNNPTQHIMSILPDSLKNEPLKTSASVLSISVLETSVEGALPVLQDVFKNKGSMSTVNLHFGVDDGANVFNLEECASNEATFTCPDERGYAPQNQAIHPRISDLKHKFYTRLPVMEIQKRLRHLGFEVKLSQNPGLFLCNYVYYQSLYKSLEEGVHAIFVHVPPFSCINKETQLKFVRSIIEIISDILVPGTTN